MQKLIHSDRTLNIFNYIMSNAKTFIFILVKVTGYVLNNLVGAIYYLEKQP